MDSQRIFILVKPDGVERGLVGEILGRIEAKGYKLEDLRFMRAKEEVLRVHYAHLADKPFFPEIVRYMTRGPVVAAIFSGANVIEGVRALAGATNPTQAVPGSIRGDLAREWGHGNIENLIHASDSDENAEKEISLWFN
ncbi:nucleoside diphosphate kinase [Actinomyces sp. oral taxon 848 str. F0332]|uniref:Nucleoside diphosphate kinase n=1 Tax=Peptidiphaga gingivicola TaxID=2741497 RepID=A0A179B1Z6_9ACTO|nr:nucleoside-diphosphate kinase [Peptidiphaga gingivicola]EEZ77249.1 nucleoside diphosphate kinase [Actinomyces sp. oral taxon 848 str. F0332]OAP85395.1 nucleoside-diphosphate kinase [Peptidiphaga gingivicola]